MRRLASILAAAGIAAAALAGGATAEDDARTYKIEMYNAFGIVEGSEVRVTGVNVGKVLDLTVNENKRALVTVEVSGDMAVLGEDTTCSSEPQSLIAEYFIDCEPAGEPLEEGGTVPASQVSQTVQPDLVQNTLRDPFRDRLRLLINEFGTGLAGNGEALNEAIRLGAPALTELQEATGILVKQREMIRELNSDSATIIGELAKQRNEIVDFVDEAEDAARISVERRDDLSTNFALLDDFLAEFRPTLVELDRLAVEQTPLLENLRAAAPGLNRLALNLPSFNRATDTSLDTLGEAARVGKRALDNGDDELALLAEAGRKAPVTLEILADFLQDIDDPRRAIEIDDRAGEDTGRSGLEPATRDTMGYTGMEGLLNYIRNQTLSINQFDKVGHLFRFGIYEVFESSPCGKFSSGRDPMTGEKGVPAQGGGLTTEFENVADCVGWLGANQPGISEEIGLEPYDSSVCPNGTVQPGNSEQQLCVPPGPRREGGAGGDKSNNRSTPAKPESAGSGGNRPEPGDPLGDILDDPAGSTGLGGPRGAPAPAPEATDDLLDFLFTP